MPVFTKRMASGRWYPTMVLEQVLSPLDVERASRTLRNLTAHNVSDWALTGGLAIEIHLLRGACVGPKRALNDLDFVASSFESIPGTLSQHFLFLHRHPSDPPGRMMLQAIDRDTGTRIDVFRAAGSTMSRTSAVDLPGGLMRLVSLEDLAARAARLSLDLATGACVPAKHAVDFMRLAPLVDASRIETVWQDHRKPQHPGSFTEAVLILQGLISAKQDLLVTPEYSLDPPAFCARCQAGTRIGDASVQ